MDPLPPLPTSQTTPPEPVSPSPAPHPKSANNIPVVLMSILLLILMGLIGFLYYQNLQLKSLIAGYQAQSSPAPSATPDVTANWKTYTNTKHGYLFKYPSNFSVGTEGNADTATADGIIVTDNCNYNSGDRCLTGTFDANKLVYDASKKLSDYFEYAPGQAPQILSEQSITIGGNPALARVIFDNNYYYDSTDHGVVRYTVVTVHDQTVFHFDFVERGEDQKLIISIQDWQKKNIADQILSTFQFPEQTGNNDQKTVTNLVNNFYTALTNQDGKTLFSYMTPPATASEEADYNWLTGMDTGTTPIYRVFIRSKITGPQITNIQKQSDVSYLVSITDQFYGYSNAGQTVGYTTPQARTGITMTVVNISGTWLVDKFTDGNYLGGNAQTQKYNGFDQ